MRYNSVLDLHTHTLVSGHAYCSLREMAKAAADKGLEVLGITEHAPAMPGTCHKYYFENLKIVPREMYGIQLLLGSEVNILDAQGTVDLVQRTLERMDVVIASLHMPCMKPGSKLENTESYLNVMKNPYVNIIGHPDDGRYEIDYEALVQGAKEYGKVLELNNHSMDPECTRENAVENDTVMLELCKKYQVPVVMDSDAHFDLLIGEFDLARDLLEKLDFPEELVLPADMEKFAVEKESADYTYTITIVDTLPEVEGELLVNRVDLQVFRNGEGLESRLIGVKGEERPYALYRETAQKHAQVFVGRWYLDGVAKYEVVFLSLLALERRLSERPCLILHCAYLEYQGKAMLFSAPSGTGKTTQAGLWEQYRGSRTVNGDKALLEYDGKTWTANGWPVCGTSEVCENKKLPIGCIVMLSQAKLNQAWRLRPAEAFTSLYGQITMNRWEREGLVKNLDLLERLVGKVPIYHLACDISEDAVKTLEQELMRDSSEEAAAAAFLQKNAMRKMEKKA